MWFARNVRQVWDGLVRRSGRPRHRAFGDCEAELEQFAMDPRGAPETVRRRHTPDEASKL